MEIKPTPQPFNRGLEAIITADDNLWSQVKSFLLFGVLFGALLGAVIGVILAPILHTSNNINAGEVLLVTTAAGIIYSLIFGYVAVPAAENGVPKLFGSYVDWWLAPSGGSWWLPAPFGELNQSDMVHIGEEALTLNFSQIESADNVQMTSSITPRFRVLHPLTFIRYGTNTVDGNSVSQAAIALGGLFERTLRWYIASKLSTNLPAAKGEATRILSGTQDSFHSDKTDNEKSKEVRFSVKDGSADGRPLHDIAADMGFAILEVIVNDFTLPTSITEAAEKERVEEAEQRAELTEIDTLAKKVTKLKEALPNLSDKEALQAVQAESGKRDVIDVGGDGGDFTKGAAVNTSEKRKK